jgi:hypothetical protein
MLRKMNARKTLYPLLTGLIAFAAFFITACSDDSGGDEPDLIPVITSFSPASGEVGDQVTISGTDLGDATSVRFGQTDATITSNTNTEIVTAVPEGATSGSITVVTAGGTAVSENSFEVITVGGPVVTEISAVSAQRGETITVTGEELSTVNSVAINGTEATVVSTTDNTVEVTLAEDTPLGAATLLLQMMVAPQPLLMLNFMLLKFSRNSATLSTETRIPFPQEEMQRLMLGGLIITWQQ